MRARKVVGGKTARVEQCDRQRIAQRQRRRGAGGRCEIERTSLLVDGRVEEYVGLARERRCRVAGDHHQLGALALDQRHDLQQLVALAGVGDADEDVVALDHAEVAVARFRGVDEVRGRPGARQRGSDLARDVTRLADAAHDHASLAGENQRHCGEKAVVQARDQRAYGVGLDLENPARELQRRCRSILRYHGDAV
jgi:hypothetical protein